MKAKETQMLGILALIAVGIILLCMWGNADDGANAVPGENGSGGQSAGEDTNLEQLYEDLLSPSTVAREEEEVAQLPSEGEYTIELGPPAERPWPAPSEENLIRNVIEESQPQEIALDPPEPEHEAEEERERESEPRDVPRRTLVHIVQKGETLSTISKEHYGTAGRWKQILQANQDVLSDPRRMMPGMKLTIPAVANGPEQESRSAASRALSSSTSASSDERTHVVREGDTFYRIAQKYCDDGSQWKKLLRANSDLVSDPQDLRPGMKVRLP